MYDSDKHVTLKYGQSQQTWYELLDPKQSNNQKKFERPPLHSVPQTANVKRFFKSENMSIISRKCVQKWKKSGAFIIYLTHLTFLQSFNLTGKENKSFSENCSTLLWPWNMVKVT